MSSVTPENALSQLLNLYSTYENKIPSSNKKQQPPSLATDFFLRKTEKGLLIETKDESNWFLRKIVNSKQYNFKENIKTIHELFETVYNSDKPLKLEDLEQLEKLEKVVNAYVKNEYGIDPNTNETELASSKRKKLEKVKKKGLLSDHSGSKKVLSALKETFSSKSLPSEPTITDNFKVKYLQTLGSIVEHKIKDVDKLNNTEVANYVRINRRALEHLQAEIQKVTFESIEKEQQPIEKELLRLEALIKSSTPPDTGMLEELKKLKDSFAECATFTDDECKAYAEAPKKIQIEHEKKFKELKESLEKLGKKLEQKPEIPSEKVVVTKEESKIDLKGIVSLNTDLRESLEVVQEKVAETEKKEPEEELSKKLEEKSEISPENVEVTKEESKTNLESADIVKTDLKKSLKDVAELVVATEEKEPAISSEKEEKAAATVHPQETHYAEELNKKIETLVVETQGGPLTAFDTIKMNALKKQQGEMIELQKRLENNPNREKEMQAFIEGNKSKLADFDAIIPEASSALKNFDDLVGMLKEYETDLSQGFKEALVTAKALDDKLKTNEDDLGSWLKDIQELQLAVPKLSIMHEDAKFQWNDELEQATEALSALRKKLEAPPSEPKSENPQIQRLWDDLQFSLISKIAQSMDTLESNKANPKQIEKIKQLTQTLALELENGEKSIDPLNATFKTTRSNLEKYLDKESKTTPWMHNQPEAAKAFINLQLRSQSLLEDFKKAPVINEKDPGNVVAAQTQLTELKNRTEALLNDFEQTKIEIFLSAPALKSLPESARPQGKFQTFAEVQKTFLDGISNSITSDKSSADSLAQAWKELKPGIESDSVKNNINRLIHKAQDELRQFNKNKALREEIGTNLALIESKIDNPRVLEEIQKNWKAISDGKNFITKKDLKEIQQCLNTLLQNNDPAFKGSHEQNILLYDILWSVGQKEIASKLYSKFKDAIPSDDKRLTRIPPQRLGEQLRSLTSIAKGSESKGITPSKAEDLINFCYSLSEASQTRSYEQKESGKIQKSLLKTEQLLGKALTVLDKNPTALNDIDFTNQGIAKKQIEDAFAKLLTQTKQSIDTIWQDQLRLPLSGFANVPEVQVPMKIADFLITSDGKLNQAIIPEMRKALLHTKEARYTFEKNIAHQLRAFYYSEQTRKALESIGPPNENNEIGKTIIQASFGKPSGEEITERDARVAALGASLSQWRQGPIGSCFVSSVTIQTLTNSLCTALSHFKEIIEEGKMVRIINNQPVEFITIPNVSQNHLDSKITVDSTTQEVKTVDNSASPSRRNDQDQIFIHEALAMQRACLALGIADSKKACSDALNVLIKDNKPITPRTILKQIIEQNFSGEPKEQKDAIMQKAFYAFGSTSLQPLVHSLENTLAGMSRAPSIGDGTFIDEDTAGKREGFKSTLRKALIDTTSKATQTIDGQKIPIDDAKQSELINLLINSIPISKVRFFYDPGAPTTSESIEAFVIFIQNDKGTFDRIDSPERYAFAIKNLLSESYKTLAQTQDQTTNELLKEIVEQLDDGKTVKNIVDAAFVKCLEKYTEAKPLDTVDWTTYKQVPWRYTIGASPSTICQVQWQTAPLAQKEAASMKDESLTTEVLKERMESIIEMLQPYQQGQVTDPSFSIPAASDLHAFSLLPLHPSMPKNLTNADEIKKWTSEFLEKGKNLGNLPVDAATQNTIRDYVINNLLTTKVLQENFNKKVTKAKNENFATFISKEIPRLLKEEMNIDLSPEEFKKALPILRKSISDYFSELRNNSYKNDYAKYTYFADKRAELLKDETPKDPFDELLLVAKKVTMRPGLSEEEQNTYNKHVQNLCERCTERFQRSIANTLFETFSKNPEAQEEFKSEYKAINLEKPLQEYITDILDLAVKIQTKYNLPPLKRAELEKQYFTQAKEKIGEEVVMALWKEKVELLDKAFDAKFQQVGSIEGFATNAGEQTAKALNEYIEEFSKTLGKAFTEEQNADEFLAIKSKLAKSLEKEFLSSEALEIRFRNLDKAFLEKNPNKKEVTLSEYLQNIVTSVETATQQPIPVNDLNNFDSFILSNTLSEQNKKAFLENTLHVADLNWYEPVQTKAQATARLALEPQHLCFVVNPRTQSPRVITLTLGSSRVGIRDYEQYSRLTLHKLPTEAMQQYETVARTIASTKTEIKEEKKLAQLEQSFLQKYHEFEAVTKTIKDQQDLYKTAKKELSALRLGTVSEAKLETVKQSVQEAKERQEKIQSLSKDSEIHIQNLEHLYTRSKIHYPKIAKSLHELLKDAKTNLKTPEQFLNKQSFDDWVKNTESFLEAQRNHIAQISLTSDLQDINNEHAQALLEIDQHLFDENKSGKYNFTVFPLWTEEKDRDVLAKLISRLTETETIY